MLSRCGVCGVCGIDELQDDESADRGIFSAPERDFALIVAHSATFEALEFLAYQPPYLTTVLNATPSCYGTNKEKEGNRLANSILDAAIWLIATEHG